MGWKKGRRRRPGRPRAGKVRGHAATIVEKRIFCKSCKRCPGHGPYLYKAYRIGKKVVFKYIGKKLT